MLFTCLGGAKAQDFNLKTKLSGTEISGKVFAIVNESEDKAFYGSGANGLGYGSYSDAFKVANTAIAFKAVSLATDEDVDIRGYYLLRAIKPDGNEYSVYGGPGFLNSQPNEEGKYCCFIQGLNGDQNGQDLKNGAVWDIQYDEGSGKYSIKNIGTGMYLKDATPAKYDSPTYFSFYTYSEKIKVFSWEDLSFDSSKQDDKGVVVDDETRKVVDERGYAQYWCSSARWDLAESSRDLSGYKYLVICSTQNASKYEASVFITDGTNRMQGNDYSKYTWKEGDPEVEKSKDYTSVPSGTSMWLDPWGNQHIVVVDLDWVANTDKFGDASACKFVDITNVTSFGIGASNNGSFIDFAYLTNTKPNTSGDLVRAIGEFNKFGTICLPYNAVCSGAEIYEIASKNGSSLSLDRHWGAMEAGKPYFYKTVESQIGYWDDGLKFKDEEYVYFYKVGYSNEYTPIANNGLVGTFSDTKAPLNSYVLSSNKLYKVDVANTVTVGAYKAYVDVDAITPSLSRGNIFIDFNEPTGVSEMKVVKTIENQEVYNLAGQRVAQPTKGLYIVNGKKVVIK